jgi:hypothetical protein
MDVSTKIFAFIRVRIVEYRSSVRANRTTVNQSAAFVLVNSTTITMQKGAAFERQRLLDETQFVA